MTSALGSRFLVAVCLSALVTASSGAVVKWTGWTDYLDGTAETKTWATASYWNTSAVPTSSDTAVVGECGFQPANCGYDVQYNSLPPKVVDLGSFRRAKRVP